MLPPAKILIAEDDDLTLEFLATVLRGENYEVVTVTTGNANTFRSFLDLKGKEKVLQVKEKYLRYAGKPTGSLRPARMSGASVADAVIKDRR